MSYTFQGCQRLQLWFETPNPCALFLAMLAVLLCIADCAAAARPQKKGWRGIAVWAGRGGLTLALTALSLTYSRGGYLAAIAALSSLSWLLGSRRPWCWVAVFCLLLAFPPRTASRAASSLSIADGSIHHRLLLWEGVCAIIAEQPFSGVPLREVGLRYTAWHQPLAFDDGYRTATNDWLTFAAAFGLPLAALAMALMIMAVTAEARLVRRCPDESWRKYALAAIPAEWVAVMIAGVFNTFWLKPIFAAAHILPVAVLPWLLARHPACRRRLGRHALAAIMIAGALCAATYAMGAAVVAERGYDVTHLQFGRIGTSVLLTSPHSAGSIVFIHASSHRRASLMHRDRGFSHHNWMGEIRKRLRPALACQFNATTLYLDLGEDWEAIIASFCRQLLEERPSLSSLPLLLVSDAQCSRQVLHAIRQLPPGITAIPVLMAPLRADWEALRPSLSSGDGPRAVVFAGFDPGDASSENCMLIPLATPVRENLDDPRTPALRRLLATPGAAKPL